MPRRAHAGTAMVGIVFAVVVAGHGHLRAQQASAANQLRELHGEILDAATGAPITGASIVATGAVEKTTSSDPDGRWALQGIPVGSYRVTVTHVAFAPEAREVDVALAPAILSIPLTPRPIALDAVVVTAGRRLQRLTDAVIATELVSRREIEESGATDLASVLTERVGIELQGGHPAGSGLMIQGMGSERVLVMVDGHEVIGRISGQIDISRIPTEMIERVEIVKGPQSTLYGSEAMGGVVNVITRSAESTSFRAGSVVTAGDHGRLDMAGSVSGGTEGLSAIADVGRRLVELTPGQSAGSGQRAQRWDLNTGIAWETPIDGVRVEIGLRVLDERQRWRQGQFYQFADNRQWATGAGMDLAWGSHELGATLHATAFDHLSRSAGTMEPIPGTGQKESQRLYESDILYGYTFGPHALNAGIDVRREVIESDRVSGQARSIETLESFVQASVSWGEWTLVPGVRASWSDPWGTHWTPRMALMYRPTPELALRISSGEGFRAPDFKETHLEFLNIGPGFAYTVRGNPDLHPEVSRNLTASVEWSGSRTHARLQAFDNSFDDFIETRTVGDSSGVAVYTYGNIDGGTTRGIEIEVGMTHGGWRIDGGYSRLWAETGTGEALLGRPERSARATLSHARPSGLGASVTGVYTGRTPMSRTDDDAVFRDGFLRFDMRASHELPRGLELAFGVDNVLDVIDEEWPGFSGRHLYASISWNPFEPSN